MTVKKLALARAAQTAYAEARKVQGMGAKTRRFLQQLAVGDIVQHHSTAMKNAEPILTTPREVCEGTGEIIARSASGAPSSCGVWSSKDADKSIAFVATHHTLDVAASDYKIAVFRISMNEQLDKDRPWTFPHQPQAFPPNMNYYMSSNNVAVDRSMMTVVDVRHMFNKAGTALLTKFKSRATRRQTERPGHARSQRSGGAAPSEPVHL
jgi:hypothetical protein